MKNWCARQLRKLKKNKSDGLNKKPQHGSCIKTPNETKQKKVHCL